MKLYIYDIEIFNNLLIIVFYSIVDDEYLVFEYSELKDNKGIDQRKELLEFITSNSGKLVLIGYNSYSFDDQLLYYIIKHPKASVIDYKNIANQIIKSKWNLFKDNEIYPKYIRLGIDTMKINNYGIGSAKTTSLKMLGFNFRESDVEDLPLKHDSKVNTRPNIDKIIEYCKNDCKKTFKHFNITKPLIKYRQEFGKTFGFGLTLVNTTEVQFAKAVLGKVLGKKMNLTPYEFSKLRTYYKEISIADVLIPKKFPEKYGNIFDFELDINKDLYSFYLNTKLEIDPKKEGNLIKFDGAISKTITYDNGLTTTIGVGGVHGIVPSGIYKSDDEYVIRDFDFSNWSPKLIFKI